MPKSHRPYPAEFRRQMVELVRTGRSPASLAEEFEPSSQAIRTWAKQADLDEGLRADGSTSSESDELRRLRRENERLRQEREILKKCRGLVRTGDRHGPVEVFRFMKTSQAAFSVTMMAECWRSRRAATTRG